MGRPSTVAILGRAAFPGPIVLSGADLGRGGPGASGGGTRGCPGPGSFGPQVPTAQGWAPVALPAPPGKFAAMIASNSARSSPGSPQTSSTHAPMTGAGVAAAACAGYSRQGWSVMANCRLPGGVGQVRVGQASICLGLLSVLAMAILRGLAFSAIGIRNVNTPAS
jgi:hypothetical protein